MSKPYPQETAPAPVGPRAAPGPVSASPGFFSVDALAADFDVERLFWLIRLRWGALAGMFALATAAWVGIIPGAAWRVIGATMVGGLAYNGVLWAVYRRGAAGSRRAAMYQALTDMGMLTVVLWACGGLHNPFVGFYVLHVALMAILTCPSATLNAFIGSIVCVGALALTELNPAWRIGVWNPSPPWDLLSWGVAFITMVGAIAYLVMHSVRQLQERELALVAARDRAALEYELLVTTLNELDAGLEVLTESGDVLWHNKRVERLKSAMGAAVGTADVNDGHEDGDGVRRTTHAVKVDGQERVYERMSFSLRSPNGASRIMNLYVDRTQAVLQEGRLVLAERLVSLGRVAQGVAHELNTPLATIRTLATDMRAALKTLTDDPAQRAVVVADVDESAKLVADETRRLGRITQSLLAGGDLVQARIDGDVPLSAVIVRARAIVFAGVSDAVAVEVAAGVDPLRVSADPDRLMQIMVNLLQNALDSVRGKVGARIGVGAYRDGDEIVIDVDDNGAGIEAKVAARLFEPFATTKAQGTGLGLYTSYMMVRRMGGTITLSPRAEGGARAQVRLPAATKSAVLPVRTAAQVRPN